MSSQNLFHLAAVALIISGGSLALGLILHPMPPYGASIATSRWAVSHLLWWFGGLTGIVGLTGLYLRQRKEVGVLGFVGSGLAIIALALIASAMYFEAFIAPSLAARAPELFESFPAGGGWEGFLAGVLASGALFGIGFLLFGITMFRVGIVPRWAIVLAVLGGVPFAVNFLLPRPVAILAVTAFGIGLLGLSHGVWKSIEQPTANPTPQPTSGARVSE
jgi:hypothetical protein